MTPRTWTSRRTTPGSSSPAGGRRLARRTSAVRLVFVFACSSLLLKCDGRLCPCRRGGGIDSRLCARLTFADQRILPTDYDTHFFNITSKLARNMQNHQLAALQSAYEALGAFVVACVGVCQRVL